MLRDWFLAWQDTVTGFLLAGVGNVDLRRKSNFLVVTESEYLAAMLIQMTSLLLSLTELRAYAETSVKTIEDAFKEFTTREDIAIIMINQYVRFLLPVRVASRLHRHGKLQMFVMSSSILLQIANMIRHLLKNYLKVNAS